MSVYHVQGEKEMECVCVCVCVTHARIAADEADGGRAGDRGTRISPQILFIYNHKKYFIEEEEFVCLFVPSVTAAVPLLRRFPPSF